VACGAFAAERPAGTRYQSTAASAGRAAAAAPQHGAAAANTGSVTFTAAVAERRVVGAVMR